MDDELPENVIGILQGWERTAALSTLIAKRLEPITALGMRLARSPSVILLKDIEAHVTSILVNQLQLLERISEQIGFGVIDEVALAVAANYSVQTDMIARSLDSFEFWELQPALMTLQYVRAETVEQAVAAGTISAEQVRNAIVVLMYLLICLGSGAALTDGVLHDEWRNVAQGAIGTLIGFIGAWPQIEKMTGTHDDD